MEKKRFFKEDNDINNLPFKSALFSSYKGCAFIMIHFLTPLNRQCLFTLTILSINA